MKKNKNISVRSTLLTGCAALLAALCAALLPGLTACTDNEAGGNDEKNPADAVMLSVRLEGSEGTRANDTRANAADVPYTPDASVALQLYNGSVGAGDKQTATYYNTAESGATATWAPKSGNAPLYWDDMEAADNGASGKIYSFYAVVSHGQTLTDNSTTGAVSPEQATLNGDVPDNYNNADLLMAYTYTQKRNQPLAFTLKHLLAQFTVTLSTGTGNEAFSPEQLAAATATVGSLQPGYTLTYTSVADETGAKAAQSKPATAASTTGTTADFTLLRTVNPDGTVTFSLIAPPQTLTSSNKIVITIDGKGYTMEPSAGGIALVQGQNTVQPIVASKSGIEPGSVMLTPWKDAAEDSQNVGTDGIADPNTALTGIQEAGILKLYAYKSGGTSVSDKGTGIYPVSYTQGENGQYSASIDKTAGSGYSPILWDNLDKFQSGSDELQKYTYNATFEPTGEASLNHEKDYLGGTSIATDWGTVPSFTKLNAGAEDGNANDHRLRHLMARFTVKLQCNDGTYNTDALNAATLTVLRNKKFGSITQTSAGVTVTPAELTAGDATAVNLVKIGESTVQQPVQFSAILAPQTLKDATDGTGYLTLTLGTGGTAKTYTLKAPAAGILLETGKTYTLTATVKKTELLVGTVEVASWGDGGTGEGGFEWGGN